MSSSLAQRLACYGTVASTATVVTGDIQVYDGPPISMDDSYITLSLSGLEFTLFNSVEIDRQSGWWQGSTTCCGWETTSWGASYCTWYSQRVNFSAQSFVDLRVECDFQYLYGVKFQPVGAPVGSPPCADTNELCFVSFWSYNSCNGGDGGSSGNCDESRTYHLGFEATKPFPDFDRYRGWIRIEGPADDLKITRWAYEDSGGPIDVGEEPPPACPADLNGDGKVDGGDLGILLGNFGKKGGGIGDINGDGLVDGGDIGLMLGFWGDCN